MIQIEIVGRGSEYYFKKEDASDFDKESYISENGENYGDWDEDDLDMRLGRSGHAVVELAKIVNRPEFPEFSELYVFLERANKPLEIDLEEIIIQVRDSVDHMNIGNKDDRLLTDLIKNYDERFAMHRKAINLVGEVVKPLKTIEDYRDETDTNQQVFQNDGPDAIITNGDIEIDTINEIFKTDLSAGDDYSRLNGLLHEKLHDIPKEGDKLEIDSLRIIVEKVSKNKPEKIRIEKIKD